jgi:hypothetical protein
MIPRNSSNIEYKYVVYNPVNDSCQWEDGDNRVLILGDSLKEKKEVLNSTTPLPHPI